MLLNILKHLHLVKYIPVKHFSMLMSYMAVDSVILGKITTSKT